MCAGVHQPLLERGAVHDHRGGNPPTYIHTYIPSPPPSSMVSIPIPISPSLPLCVCVCVSGDRDGQVGGVRRPPQQPILQAVPQLPHVQKRRSCFILHACSHVYMYVCMYDLIYVCMYVCMPVCASRRVRGECAVGAEQRPAASDGAAEVHPDLGGSHRAVRCPKPNPNRSV